MIAAVPSESLFFRRFGNVPTLTLNLGKVRFGRTPERN